MQLTLDSCSNGLEQALLWTLIVSTLTLFLSALMVFTNEKASDSSTWRILPYLLVWPIYPFFTSDGLNLRGKKWRIPYCISFTAVMVLALVMLTAGYCNTKT